jgi:hypothetical protein
MMEERLGTLGRRSGREVKAAWVGYEVHVALETERCNWAADADKDRSWLDGGRVAGCLGEVGTVLAMIGELRLGDLPGTGPASGDVPSC